MEACLLCRFSTEEQIYCGRKCCKCQATSQDGFGSRMSSKNSTCNKTGSHWIYHVVFCPILKTIASVPIGEDDVNNMPPSMTHSMPANSAPTLPNPLPLLHIPLPMSLKISRAFWVLFIPACDCARKYGSSYAKDVDIREKKAPMPRPTKKQNTRS